ncbi:MAG: sn-glycerol-3-phosphate ABC transporter ATP-binding protein UgpC [Phycisphaerales bacterium]|nr:sn-glycerol-3-phosphate ABC transporter ATP-binding protein UgpC [Phycisphaerales bacterium]
MASVQLESVNKIFPGNTHAVNDCSLEIGDGEFVVLVGPSGCGKSTLLRMVAGLEDLTSGTIRIGEQVVNDVAPKNRNIAMVFQNYALYPHKTARANMEFALKLRKMPRAERDQRVQAAARQLGIEELLDRRPAQMSGGQQQRVALGRALVREPACFLFDEPLSNLDAKLRSHMRGELKELHRSLATTSIYVTHDQEEAMTLGDRVVVMRDGVIQQVGPPLEIYRRPLNRFVAGFIGAPAMNIIEGRVDSEGTGFDADGGISIPLPEKLQPGRGIALGIRPQHLKPVQAGSPGSITLSVRFSEPLGEETDLTLDGPGGVEMLARLKIDVQPPAGESMNLGCQVGDLHLFDVADGARIN